MRKITNLLLIALLAFAGVGCDSNDDKNNDADLFVGTWALTGVSDDDGDALAAFATNFDSIVLANAEAGTFTLTVNPKVGDDIVLDGTYTVRSSDKSFTLYATIELVPGSPQTIPLGFTYEFDGDDKIMLTTVGGTATLLNTLFDGVDLVGEAVITVSRVS